MSNVLDISDTESLSDRDDDIQGLQKVDGLGLMTSEVASSMGLGGNGASSSGTNLRSSFIGMGFSPCLIDKVIKEKGSYFINTDGDNLLMTTGEEDADLLLDTLFAHSALQGTKSMPSESSDSLPDDDKDVEAITASADFPPKQEPDLVEDLDDDKRVSLLIMNFPVADVDFAISKLGKSAPIDELVDFIMAAQIAESEKRDNLPNGDHVNRKDCNTEALFGTMDKTLQLLGMGFNEQEVSLAIEQLGVEVPIIELANCICASQMGESYSLNGPNGKKTLVPSKMKRATVGGSWYSIKGMPNHSGDIFAIKTEKPDEYYPSQSRNMDFGNIYEDIKPKDEYLYEPSSSVRNGSLNDVKGKRPKEEYEDDLSSCGGYTRKKSKNLTIGNNPSPHRNSPSGIGMPKANPSARSTDKGLYGPPYFLYGNLVNLTADVWQKLSQFLYSIQPEFVNTQLFSALNRMEGYIHNLPIEDRFHIEPKSPMTITEAIPHMKKWWPSWDTRKQLNCISSDAAGSSQICSSLERMLVGSRGALAGDQQTRVLYYCRTMNLVWVGPKKLAPMEPEHVERILGYPINHTRNPDMTLTERLESLKHCFQTDTLGFYLSALKPLFPGGITLLSVYSGIGGAEVALHRLGIYLKAVVSVESSEIRRKVLRRWWQNTDQTGELVQIEGVQKLTSNKLEFLANRFGGFDLILCQNPCTYAEKGSKESSEVAGLDYTLYYEFVRVLQWVRTRAART